MTTNVAALFDPERFIAEQVEAVRARATSPAIVGLSGGVDSAVAAAIVARAVPDLLMAVFVDTGLLRKDETAHVAELAATMKIKNFRSVDASKEFLDALEGIEDPEEKRRVIGERFIRVFEREAATVDAKFLVQGTIAPDWIESGGGARDTIKSHHNVGGLPDDLGLELIEPLRDLYKDEVRRVARCLGLPVAERQPFPGPGLAVRILGPVTREKLVIVREACAIVEEEIERAHAAGQLAALPWQYFATLLPVRTVGVQGDIRAYGRTVCIRAVASKDAMTAEYSRIPHDVLSKISSRITNSLKDDVNRVVFDVTDKPPGTVEWE